MARALDGSYAPDILPKMACGGTPIFDNGSGYGYRCDMCFAVIGSIGQPTSCKEMNKKAEDEKED